MSNYFQKNELIYIPVVTDQVYHTYPFKDPNRVNQLDWWGYNSFLPYNAMMISAFYGRNTIVNRRGIRNNVLFLGDSGGYQIVQNDTGHYIKDIKKILTWQNVIEWQLKVADIGMTLDIPPLPPHLTKSDYSKSYEESYEENLIKSAKNSIEMHKYKEDKIGTAEIPDFKLFNVIHGITPEEMERWDRETTANHTIMFDGYSSSAKLNSLLPLRLGFAIEYSKNQPYHILGSSAPRSICLMAYANKYTKTQVYFDSQTANMGRTKRKYMWYLDMTGPSFRIEEKKKDKNINLTDVCVCPICSSLQKPEDIWNDKKRSGLLISLHNLYWINNYTSFINELVKHEDDFESYIKRFSKSHIILRRIEFLDDVNDLGLHPAWEKYQKDLKKCKRKS